jgi:hypothetical protein
LGGAPTFDGVNDSTLTAGTTGTPGTTATITANSGGKSATDTVRFSGNPGSCSITTDPSTIQVGAAAKATVNVLDAAGGPVAEFVSVALAQANPGAGVNVAILVTPKTTFAGNATFDIIAGIQGAIALGATAGTITCTGTVLASGTVIPPNTGGGDGTIVGAIPGAGGFGLVTFGGSIDPQLKDALATAGCDRIFATSEGDFVPYIPSSAIAAVNAPFMALATGGSFAAGTPMLLGGC